MCAVAGYGQGKEPVKQKYDERNYFDTITVDGSTSVVRRDLLRKNFKEYLPEHSIISFNDIEYISTSELRYLLKGVKKEALRSTRKVWVSGMGFPFYKPTTSAGIGGAAILTFKANKNDDVSFRSYIPISFLASIRGQFALTFGANIFMNENKLKFRSYLTGSYGVANYFGQGGAIKAPNIKDKTTHYDQLMFKPELELLWRVGRDFYIGPAVNIHYEKLSNIADDVYEYLPNGVQRKKEILNMGIGGLLEYSTIDNPTCPYGGVVLNGRAMYFREHISTKNQYIYLSLDYKQYVQLFNRRSILAWKVSTANLVNNRTDFFLFNPSLDIRGVLEGYYFAPSIGSLSIEYRHFFASNRSYERGTLWSKVGMTVWANMGAFGRDIPSWNNFVYTVGAGLRFEVQPFKNVRFDVGRQIGGKGKMMFYFGFNEYF